ncbi:MAG: TolC family outer membrane protein [Rhodospirillales bacterium]|nr:TolC family outer membrane protein [Rhodospirillales bacterium]
MGISNLQKTGMAGVIAAALLNTASAYGEPLTALLPELLKSHNLTQAAEADLKAAQERIRASMGGWYPQLSVTAHYGHEEQNKPTGTDDTNLVARNLTISVTQLLWDFDLTNSTVRAARVAREQVNATLEAARQNVQLRGIVSYLNVLRAAEIVEFARRSESNIKHQADLEDARVERGAGFSTDVLQAKTQLAGAQARLVQAQGALRVARNAYRAMFYKDAGDIGQMVRPVLPVDMLPATVEEAVVSAQRNNPSLLVAKLSAEASSEVIIQTRASGFYPRIDAVGTLTYKDDDGGTVGSQNESIGKVQVSWPFNLGLTAVNSVRAAEGDYLATQKRYADARELIEEQTRNAWENLKTATENAELLKNQANIAAEFLELARKEQQLGRRSLLDVLAGETTLVNASSDAASAETDVSIAVFSLLAAMGVLDDRIATRLDG